MARERGAGDSHANHNPFRVLVVCDFWFTHRVGVQEEPTVPHARLAYIHLQSPSGLGEATSRSYAKYRPLVEE